MDLIRTRLRLVALALVLLPAPARAALQETPIFAAAVAKGELPPIISRLPREPSLAELETIGRPGGELRLLMASPKDTRLMVVYGYARLMAYTPGLALVPDILEAAEVSEDRVFTLRLRPGHKWSDGQPFTTEDSATGSRTSRKTPICRRADCRSSCCRMASGRISRCWTR